MVIIATFYKEVGFSIISRPKVRLSDVSQSNQVGEPDFPKQVIESLLRIK